MAPTIGLLSGYSLQALFLWQLPRLSQAPLRTLSWMVFLVSASSFIPILVLVCSLAPRHSRPEHGCDSSSILRLSIISIPVNSLFSAQLAHGHCERLLLLPLLVSISSTQMMSVCRCSPFCHTQPDVGYYNRSYRAHCQSVDCLGCQSGYGIFLLSKSSLRLLFSPVSVFCLWEIHPMFRIHAFCSSYYRN